MEKIRYEQVRRFEHIHWWYRGRQYLLKRILAKLKLPKQAKLLDIGCGAGATLATLSRYGNVYGIDIELSAVRYCRKRFTHVLVANATKIPYSSSSFNVVCALDVLEHIKDEEKTFDEIWRVLKSDGVLILFVPAFPILWGFLDTHSHHQRRYTKKTLVRNMKREKFDIHTLKYFNYFLFLPILLVRCIQRIPFLINQWGVYPEVKSLTINDWMTWLFKLDVCSIDVISPPFGVSLMLIANKRIVKR